MQRPSHMLTGNNSRQAACSSDLALASQRDPEGDLPLPIPHPSPSPQKRGPWLTLTCV